MTQDACIARQLWKNNDTTDLEATVDGKVGQVGDHNEDRVAARALGTAATGAGATRDEDSVAACATDTAATTGAGAAADAALGEATDGRNNLDEDDVDEGVGDGSEFKAEDIPTHVFPS